MLPWISLIGQWIFLRLIIRQKMLLNSLEWMPAKGLWDCGHPLPGDTITGLLQEICPFSVYKIKVVSPWNQWTQQVRKIVSTNAFSFRILNLIRIFVALGSPYQEGMQTFCRWYYDSYYMVHIKWFIWYDIYIIWSIWYEMNHKSWYGSWYILYRWYIIYGIYRI